MTLAILMTAILVGLLTGWLAGFVMPDGCHGLLADLSLGVGGSSVASLLLGALDVAPEAGQLVTVAAGVSFVGAVIVIVASAGPGLRALETRGMLGAPRGDRDAAR